MTLVNKVGECYRVCMGPGKSWNFIINGIFQLCTGKSWKKAAAPGKFWKYVKLK